MSTEVIQITKKELQSLIREAIIKERNQKSNKHIVLDYSKDKEICIRTILAIFDRIGFFEFMEGKMNSQNLSSLLSAITKANPISLNVYKNSIKNKRVTEKHSVTNKHYQKADEILEELKFKN